MSIWACAICFLRWARNGRESPHYWVAPTLITFFFSLSFGVAQGTDFSEFTGPAFFMSQQGVEDWEVAMKYQTRNDFCSGAVGPRMLFYIVIKPRSGHLSSLLSWDVNFFPCTCLHDLSIKVPLSITFSYPLSCLFWNLLCNVYWERERAYLISPCILYSILVGFAWKWCKYRRWFIILEKCRWKVLR